MSDVSALDSPNEDLSPANRYTMQPVHEVHAPYAREDQSSRRLLPASLTGNRELGGTSLHMYTRHPEERDMFEHMQPSVRDPEWDVREARILAREEAFEREGACVREGNGAGQTQAGSNLSS